MWPTVCKCLCAAAACAVLLSGTAGCSSSGAADDPPSVRSEQQRLFENGILTENNLTVRTISEEKASFRLSEYYCKIDGLKDRATEDKINDRISEVVALMYGGEYVPPYRGIAVKLRQIPYSRAELSGAINVFTKFNSNNILSLTAYCNLSYRYTEDEEEKIFYYSYGIPLNFDLTTGEELTLKDIFAPDADYIELVNGAMDQALLQSGYDSGPSEIMLTAPFQGITPEQKFYISEDGDICLVLDYDTPAFYTDFYSAVVNLGSDRFGDALALFKTSDEPIYESDQTVYRFMRASTDKGVDRSMKLKDNLTFFGEYHYRENTPETVLQRLEAITFDKEYRPTDIDAIYNEVARVYGSDGWDMDVSSYASAQGLKSDEYFSVSRNYAVYIWSENAWLTDDPAIYEPFYQTKYCFDKEGRPVELYDLFAAPEKASALIEQVMTENLIRETVAERESTEQYVQKLVPHINGVNICTDCLALSFDLTGAQIREMIYEFFGDVDGDYFYTDAVTSLPYRDIGCENLVIFNPAP